MENALALVFGQPLNDLPDDLYIPPEALRIFLEAFEGPLDLLLYLIKKQNLDILNIPIAKITEQYMEYIQLMHSLDLDLAAEYLVMAATLAEIKSRMLLPRPELDEDEDFDPRAALVRRLQEYERFKHAASEINELPRLNRDTFLVQVAVPDAEVKIVKPEADVSALVNAFREVLSRVDLTTAHAIAKEPLSVREKMAHILDQINNNDSFTDFNFLFDLSEGRVGVVVTFLAILELAKDYLIQIVQNENYGPIYLKPAGAEHDASI